MTKHAEYDPLDEAPILRAIPKEAPFVVPVGFFDRFPTQVQAAVARPQQTTVWMRLLAHRWSRPAFGAVVGLALVGGVLLLNRTAPTPMADASESTATWYLDDDLRNDSELLAELQSTNGSPGVQHDLDLDELTAYLVDHNDLPLDLITELQ
ncbi:MAG: hypothetical protein IPM46_06145 [Flavobacteriales bacterium]|nr:hypothetical protein [Flavobacteriales bacterium]